jgi:hypothetical protein
MVHSMSRDQYRRWGVGGATLLILASGALVAEEPTPAAQAGFNAYVARVESRLAEQHQSAASFLAPVDRARLRNGEVIIEKLTPEPGAELPGALIHDWRGTAFVPGAHGEDFVRLLKDLPAYPRVFAPEVLSAGSVVREGDRIEATLRVKQQHVITVVLDTDYDISFSQLDAAHGSSLLRSTRVVEIDAPGTAHERALSASEQHGFLWQMNLYWSYEERDGGLYLQLESVSLSRSIPTGLGWLIGPFVESVPKESLEFTLRGAQNALKK